MMEIYNQKEAGGARMQAVFCDRPVMQELSPECSLPDYQPPVRRLLRVSATVSPPDRYIGSGSTELSGRVDYSILYSTDDGSLCSAAQSEEYRITVPTEVPPDADPSEGVIADVELRPEMAGGRVAGPRKLVLRCRLRGRVRLLGGRNAAEEIKGGGDQLQRLQGTALCRRLFVGSGEVLHLGDEILFDAHGEELRVITARGEVYMTEAQAGSGCVNCRGEAVLSLLTAREGSEEAPQLQVRRIPFSASVPVPGAEVNCDATARGICADVAVTVEDGRILCEVGVIPEARAFRNESVVYTRDAYSVAADGGVQYGELCLPLGYPAAGGNFSLNTLLTPEEAGLRPGQVVVDALADAEARELECRQGKYILTGRCRVHTVLSEGGEMSAQEFEVPFRYEADGAPDAVADFDAEVVPITCRVRVDGERVSVDAELAVSISARGESRITVLTAADFSEPLRARASAYTLCYPAATDTLWSVAKRYHRSVDAIAALNPLSGAPAADAPDSLAGVRFLLV